MKSLTSTATIVAGIAVTAALMAGCGERGDGRTSGPTPTTIMHGPGTTLPGTPPPRPGTP